MTSNPERCINVSRAVPAHDRQLDLLRDLRRGRSGLLENRGNTARVRWPGGRPGARRGRSSVTPREPAAPVAEPVMSTLPGNARPSPQPCPVQDKGASRPQDSIGGTQASNHRRRTQIPQRRSRHAPARWRQPHGRRPERSACPFHRGTARIPTGPKSSPSLRPTTQPPSTSLPGPGRGAGQRRCRPAHQRSPPAMANRWPTGRGGHQRLPVRRRRLRPPPAARYGLPYATVWS